MLCYFLLYILVNQLCTYILCLWSLPPPSITPLQVLTEHRVELPVIYSSFLLSIYGSICSYSLFVPLSPSPSVSKSSFSMIASLFLPCRSIHQYHFSRFHRYHIPSHRFILIYDIYFSHSDMLHPVWQTLSLSASLQMSEFYSFLLQSDIPLYRRIPFKLGDFDKVYCPL